MTQVPSVRALDYTSVRSHGPSVMKTLSHVQEFTVPVRDSSSSVNTSTVTSGTILYVVLITL